MEQSYNLFYFVGSGDLRRSDFKGIAHSAFCADRVLWNFNMYGNPQYIGEPGGVWCIIRPGHPGADPETEGGN